MCHYLVTLNIINTLTTMTMAAINLATVNLLLAFGVRFLLKGHLGGAMEDSKTRIVLNCPDMKNFTRVEYFRNLDNYETRNVAI